MLLNTKILITTVNNWGLELLILGWFFFILWPFGPGVTFDSVSFIQSGDNFWSGKGYVHSGADGAEFAAHRFPLYPLILSLLSFSKWGYFLFQILLFSGSLLGFRYLLKKMDAPRYFLAAFFFSSIILNYYALWTEGLYGVLFILLLILLKREEDFKPLLWVGVVVGLLCLTKMVGVMCGMALLLAYIFEKRAVRGILVALVSIVVITFWTFLGYHFLGDTARPVSSHLITFSDVQNVFVALGHCVLPMNANNYLSLLIGLILFSFPIFYLLKNWKERAALSILQWFLVLHFFGYIAFILFSKSFIDASIPFEFRTFFPLYINLFALAVIIPESEVLSNKLQAKIRYLFPKLFLVFAIWNAVVLIDFREVGIGYNSADWQAFDFPNQIRELEATKVYTNDQAAVNYFSDFKIDSRLLPEKQNLYSLEQNEFYKEEFDVLLSVLNESPDAKIVWVRNGITESVYPTYEELKIIEAFEVVYDDWLCLILKAK